MILLLLVTYFINSSDNINDIEADTNNQKTYNYSIETVEFGTVYIHGVVPERTDEISEVDAVTIANQKLIEEGYLDHIKDNSHTLVYHLNYINIISSEYSMWGVFAEIDGTYQYECLVSVSSGEIITCFPTKDE